MGDFNLDIKDPYKYNLIKNIELLFQFKQLISEPTHVSNKSSTIIDLIFTNIKTKHVDCRVIPHPLSDHISLLLLFPLNFRQNLKLKNTAIKGV